jgi:hypothetical protein
MRDGSALGFLSIPHCRRHLSSSFTVFVTSFGPEALRVRDLSVAPAAVCALPQHPLLQAWNLPRPRPLHLPRSTLTRYLRCAAARGRRSRAPCLAT